LVLTKKSYLHHCPKLNLLRTTTIDALSNASADAFDNASAVTDLHME